MAIPTRTNVILTKIWKIDIGLHVGMKRVAKPMHRDINASIRKNLDNDLLIIYSF